MISQHALNPDVPLHHQIYLQLKAEIGDGLWVGRADFPGEIELDERFGVSVITTRKALGRLDSERWIDRGRGRRARVLRGPSLLTRVAAPEVVHHIHGKPQSFKYQVLRHGTDIAPSEAWAAFGLPAGSKLWLCNRLRTFRGRAHSISLNAQAIALGESHSMAQLRRYPMIDILRKSGIQLSTLSRTLGASLAPALAARHLGLTIHDPALTYTFSYYD